MATIDLLVPAYTSRPRSDRKVGKVVTTEVPGLAVALRRPPVAVEARLRLTSGEVLDAAVLLPDAVSMLALKVAARGVRFDERDATDLWRCLEVAYEEGVSPVDLREPPLDQLATRLRDELGRDGSTVDAITAELTPESAGATVTRIQALLRRVVGA